MPSITITGVVINSNSKQPISNVRVEAWDKDIKLNDVIGSHFTDEKGRFSISYDEIRFKENPKDKWADIFFKVYSRNKLIADTRNTQLLKNVSANQFDVTVYVDSEYQDIMACTVQGRILSNRRVNFTSLNVQVLDKDLRTEQKLATVNPDQNGHFLADYSLDKIKNAESGTADLLIRVLDKEGNIIGESNVKFNASYHEIIDVALNEEVFRGMSDYESITKLVTPLLDKLLPEDLTEDEKHHDISFLATELEVSEGLVESFAGSHKLNKATPIDPAFYFGLLHQGIPSKALLLMSVNLKKPEIKPLYPYLQTDRVFHALLNLSVSEVETGMRTALDHNIIPLVNDNVVKRWINQWQKIKKGGSDNDIVKSSLVESILDIAKLPGDKKAAFLEEYRLAESVGVDFWKRLTSSQKLEPAERDQVKAVYDLSSLMEHDMDSTATVAKKFRIRDENSLRKLTSLDEKDWSSILKKSKKSNQKKSFEVTPLMHRIEKKFPTAAFAARSSKASKPLEGGQAVEKLHKAFPEAELHKISIPQFIRANKTSLKIKKDEEQKFSEDLMKVQRVFKIAPQYKATEVLLKNNIHSASAIYKMGENNFVNLVTSKAGVEKTEALSMYRKAETTHALSLAIAGDFHSITTGGALNALPEVDVSMLESTLLKEFPNLQTLFGSADMCECQHCRSVYSPAAYLVDILEFLDKRASTTAGQSVKTVLFQRRPDIGEIELTCSNTNIPMPFIDLVCEILEDAVADNFYPLAASLNADLAITPISINLKTAILNHKLSVSSEATVLQGKDVNEWIVRDNKNTYKITKTGAQLRLRVSRQTHLSAEELKAKPEYINKKAYETLLTQKFPFCLPFDIAWHSCTGYLKVLNVGRYDLMKTFQLSTGPTNLQMAYEYIGMPEVIGNIVAGTDGGTIADYWGDVTLIGDVNTFLSKTDLSYNQMLELFECKFINPSGSVSISVPAGASMCDASIQTINGLTNGVLGRVHRFLRLWKTLNWTFWQLDMVVMSPSMKNGLINPDFLLRLQQFIWVKTYLKISVEELVTILDGFTAAPVPESLVTNRESLYQKLFLDRGVFDPLDEAFYYENIKQGTTAELPAISELLIDHLPVITGGLKLSTDDFSALEHLTGNKKLTLTNLDLLFRYSKLAKSLRLSISDFLIFLELHDNSLPISSDNAQNPFVSLSNLEKFVKTRMTLQTIPLKLNDYNYLFTHRISSEDKKNLDESIEKHVEEVRKALEGINKDLAVDATGSVRDWVKAKLGILPTFNEEAINDFIKLVDQNGTPAVTVTETALLNTLFNNFIQVTGAGGLLSKLNETTPADIESRLEGKYRFIKDKLAEYFKAVQSREQLVLLTSKTFKLSEKSSAVLLDNLEINSGVKLTEEFLADPNIIGSMAINEVNFADLFKASRLLHKSSILIRSLSLNEQQVRFIIDNGIASGLPTFNALPLTETAAFLSIEQLEKLCAFVELHKKYPGNEELNLTTCLDEAFAATGSLGKFNFLLSSITHWSIELIESVELYFNFTFPASYQIISNLSRLDTAMELILQLKTGTTEISSAIRASLTFDDATLVENIVKSQFEKEVWLEKSYDVQAPIRELKRNALAQYLINNPVAGESWNSTNDLYAYYLIDVEMGACEVTTRILQAGLSVQLFVQRCLMQLELEVIADAEADNKWLQWKWMKNYRVWEANRKVFLYPENYLEPELRPDKSYFFKDLENDLMQNEVNLENVETGYLNYLEKLDNVARLNVCGTYYDENTLIFHVFGHTYDEPRIYYYRKWIKDRYWTPWEKVTADIQSDQLIPVVRNSRLYIYWPEFNEVNEEPSSSELTPPNQSGGSYPASSSAKKYSEIRLAVCEFKNKKWSPKKLSKTKIDTRSLYGGSSSYKKENFVFVPIIDSLQSVLDFLYMFIGSDPSKTDAIEDFLESLDIRNKNVIVCLYEHDDPGLYHTDSYWGLSAIETFDLGSCHGTPEIADSFTSSTSANPLIPYFDRSGYHEGENREVVTDTPDSLVFHQWGLIPSVSHAALINKTPGNFRTQFSLQLSIVDKFFYTLMVLVQRIYMGAGYLKGYDRHGLPYATSTFLPFFYEDRSRTFMVQPELLIAYPDPDDGTKTKADEIFYSDILKFIREFAANKTVPDELKKYTDEGVRYDFYPAMRFRNFYHPLVCFFMKQVYTNGLEGLLNRDIQLVGDLSLTDPMLRDKIRNKFKEVKLFDFKKVYDPTSAVNPFQYPEEEVDFSEDGSYSQYNWELFFHGPLYVASKLSNNQKFEDAMKWYHYIFDPTDASSYATPQKFWITKPFFLRSSTGAGNDYLKQRIDQILGMIHNNDLSLLKRLDDWKDNPFQPHLIAQFRTVAYQKSVVMKYIDNLIAWGDSLFRQNTRESLGQATQMYVLAAEILGPKPKIIPNRNGKAPKSYNQLKPGLDSFSNAIIQLENVIPSIPDPPPGSPAPSPLLPAIETFYFCLPVNEKLLGYWDKISLRLFNLRNCLTIDGEPRFNALFEPPIDPALLVKAVAAGVDLSDAISDMNAPLPYYRFNLILQKAKEFNNEVKALGAAILSALEKKDGEALALLRSTNEIKVLQAGLSLKKYAIQDSKESLNGLRFNKKNAELKIRYYGGQLYMNPLESAAFGLSTASTIVHTIGSVADILAGALALIPQFNGGASGFGGSPHVTVSYGSEQISKAAELGAKVFYQTSAIIDKVSGLVSTQAGYVRRKEEWDFQKAQAENDLQQINRQISSAEIKIAMAEKELKNHELQIENNEKTDDFMRTKFSNIDLYDWMIGQISSVYFQSYKMALDVAKKAEKCYRYELAVENTNFIQPGYWDSLYKGLQSADKLAFDLNRMDGSYLDQNKREHEMTKTISLAMLDPLAFIELKELGPCEITIPESIFDLDCPGHYLRRIKSVTVSIPCIAGPYTSVNCKLTLMASIVRKNTLPGASYFRDTTAEDSRFAYNYGVVQSIITSNGQNDAGVFEANLKDERYLPFEGQGAISRWKVELLQLENAGKRIRNFDFSTISDVLLQMRYTARYGGDPFRKIANDAITNAMNSIMEYANTGRNRFYKVIPLKHEFSTEWHRFFHPPLPAGDQQLEISLTKDHFPFFMKENDLNIIDADIYVRYKKAVVATPFRFTFDLAAVAAPATLGAAVDSLGLKKYVRSSLNNSLALTAVNYKITAWKQSGASHLRFTENDVDDMIVVIHYETV